MEAVYKDDDRSSVRCSHQNRTSRKSTRNSWMRPTATRLMNCCIPTTWNVRSTRNNRQRWLATVTTKRHSKPVFPSGRTGFLFPGTGSPLIWLPPASILPAVPGWSKLKSSLWEEIVWVISTCSKIRLIEAALRETDPAKRSDHAQRHFAQHVPGIGSGPEQAGFGDRPADREGRAHQYEPGYWLANLPGIFPASGEADRVE